MNTDKVRRGVEEWPNWQRAYVHGTLVIVPPSPVRETVNRLREECDPASHVYFGAHVTLTQPLLRKPEEDDWSRLAQIAAGFNALRIEYGPLNSFLPYPCIYFQIHPAESILALRHAFHRLGMFNLDLPHTDDFIPHMTITEGRSGPKVDSRLFEVLKRRHAGGSFFCNEVTWIVPDPRFHFAVGRTLAFRTQP